MTTMPTLTRNAMLDELARSTQDVHDARSRIRSIREQLGPWTAADDRYFIAARDRTRPVTRVIAEDAGLPAIVRAVSFARSLQDPDGQRGVIEVVIPWPAEQE